MKPTALILIDIQNDYFPGGKLELSESTATALRARAVLDAFRRKGLPIFHIQNLSVRPGAFFMLPHTPGVEIHETVKPLPDETVIQKHYPNSFRGTGLLDALKRAGIEHLVIVGMMSHMCVDATTRAAFDLGFTCTVIHDACTTRDLEFGNTIVPAAHAHATIMSAFQWVYAKVVSSDEFIRTL